MKSAIVILIIMLISERQSGNSDLTVARKLYDSGKYYSSIKLLQGILSKEPKNYLVCDYLALNYKQIKYYDTAYLYADSSITLGNTSFEAFINAGDIAYKLDKRMESLNFFLGAYRKDSSGPDINYNLGLLYWLKFDLPRKGLFHLQKEIVNRPQNADAIDAVGQLFLSIDSIDSAFSYFDKAIKINTSNYLYYYHKALAYCYISRWMDATKTFTKCLDLNPNFTQAIYYRVISSIKEGKTAVICYDLDRLRKSDYVLEADSFRSIYCR